MSALVKDVAPDVPVVTQCHATGLRQMELCPDLADGVRRGCSRNDAFLVLHGDHPTAADDRLGIASDRIHTVGAGYREDFFHARRAAVPNASRPSSISANTAPPRACRGCSTPSSASPANDPVSGLHVAGGGAGPEADAIRDRMDRMAPAVVQHGQLAQPELADLARRATVCVLPSFYEGLPLVLVEALACGCRLVATDLAGVRNELAPTARRRTDHGRDAASRNRRPPPSAGPSRLCRSPRDRPRRGPRGAARRRSRAHRCRRLWPDFTWDAVYGRVETVWRRLGLSQTSSRTFSVGRPRTARIARQRRPAARSAGGAPPSPQSAACG